MNMLNTRRLRLMFSLILAILFSVIVLVASYLEPSGFSPKIFFMATLLLFLTWEYAEWVSRKLDEKLPWTKGFGKRLIYQFLCIFLGALFLFLVPYSLYKWYSITYLEVPVRDLTSYILFLVAMLGSFLLILSFLVMGLQLSLSFMEKWKNSQIIAEKLKRGTIKAQLDSLRNQIDPHFLFNNFNTLYGLIDEDSELAKEYLLELSEIYRYILNHKEEEAVPLVKEIHIARSYLFLIKNRYGDAVQVKWQISHDDTGNYLPPLTLQMLLENSIKHNSIEIEKPLYIWISTAADGYIEIKNTINKRNTVLSTEVGLKNLKQRFDFLSNKPIQITKTEENFSVRVPLLRMEK